MRSQALAGLQRHDEAIELLEDELVWARCWGAPRGLGRTLRLLGTFGRAPDVEVLREAVEITEGSPARLEHAKALVALGSALRRALRRAGQRSESRGCRTSSNAAPRPDRPARPAAVYLWGCRLGVPTMRRRLVRSMLVA